MKVKAGEDHVELPEDFDTLTNDPFWIEDVGYRYPMACLQLEEILLLQAKFKAKGGIRGRPLYYALLHFGAYTELIFTPALDKDSELKIQYFPHRKEV